MPIRKELRRYYGAAWRRYRLEVLAVLGAKCSRCGLESSRINLAHTNHDPKDGSLVALLCPSCHARFDARQRHAMTRRSRAKRAGQLWLLAEVEYAPYASWMIPRRVVRALQRGLFE